MALSWLGYGIVSFGADRGRSGRDLIIGIKGRVASIDPWNANENWRSDALGSGGQSVALLMMGAKQIIVGHYGELYCPNRTSGNVLWNNKFKGLGYGLVALGGSDIAMAIDDCPALPSDRPRLEEAVRRTTRWAQKCRAAFPRDGRALFGIVQGGVEEALRRQSASEIVSVGFDGYAIGGVSVGESVEQSRSTAALTAPLLPEDRPRYLMGMGTPTDLVEMMAMGIDMFDCVLPTRNARNGMLFTTTGRLQIKRREYHDDPRPIDPSCGCPVCGSYSRAYLRHLYVSGEILSMRLNTLHNLHHYATLIRDAREAIEVGRYRDFMNGFRARSDGRTGEGAAGSIAGPEGG